MSASIATDERAEVTVEQQMPKTAPSDGEIEQYKLYATTVETLIGRRQTLNAFFITINTLLLTGTVVVAKAKDVLSVSLTIGGAVTVAIAGICVSLVWGRLLSIYQHLSTAKFRVLHELETSLPRSPYKLEDTYLGLSRYSSAARTERWLPWVFAILYAILGAQTLIFGSSIPPLPKG